jgi:hypothetical protein
MPVLLLNREGVAAEVLELARVRIMGLLKVPDPAVKARWELKDDKATPAFDVDLAYVEEMSEDEIREAMGYAWRWVKGALHERLEGLEQRRA